MGAGPSGVGGRRERCWHWRRPWRGRRETRSSHGRRRPRSDRPLAEATAASSVSAGPGGRAGDPRALPCPRGLPGCGPLGPAHSSLGYFQEPGKGPPRCAAAARGVGPGCHIALQPRAAHRGRILPCCKVKSTDTESSCLVPTSWQAVEGLAQ